jgi:hypothetical protein
MGVVAASRAEVQKLEAGQHAQGLEFGEPEWIGRDHLKQLLCELIVHQ